MKAPQDSAHVEPSTRLFVKAVFWIAVAVGWGLVVGAIVFVLAVAFVDSTTVKREVALGMTSAHVRERLGEPDRRLRDAKRFMPQGETAAGCEQSAVSTAWLYSSFFQDDAMIFFDANDRVVCVDEGGIIFIINSAD